MSTDTWMFLAELAAVALLVIGLACWLWLPRRDPAWARARLAASRPRRPPINASEWGRWTAQQHGESLEQAAKARWRAMPWWARLAALLGRRTSADAPHSAAIPVAGAIGPPNQAVYTKRMLAAGRIEAERAELRARLATSADPRTPAD